MQSVWKKVGLLSKFQQVHLQETDPLRTPRRRWEENVRMDFKEIGINTRNWVNSTHDRDYWRARVIAALNLRVP